MKTAIAIRLLHLLVIGLLVAACAAPAPRGGSTLEAVQQTLDEAQREPAPSAAGEVPKAVSDTLLPPIAVPLPSGPVAAPEPRFDLRVHRAEARAFFMGLVEGTATNMVVHPEVSGTVSLDLKNVTVAEVMDTVREVYGYEYRSAASGYLVLPVRMQSRIFFVDYLNVRRSGSSRTAVSSGQVSDKITSSGDDSGGTVSETVPSSQIQTESSADFWADLQQALRTLVSGEGRSVVISPQSGVVVVRALPAELREVEAYLGATLEVLQRQVILEAKIVEVTLSSGFQSGINWAQLGTHNGESLVIGQTGGGTIFDSGVSEVAGNAGVLDPTAAIPVVGTATSAFGGVFTAAVSASSFNAFLELLKTQGDVQVLSSPRVATVNNQKAVIKVGTDEFFVTEISATTTTGTATTTTPEIELTPFFSGIALDVTPQIARSGEIILHIHPTVSEVVDQVKSITVAGQTQSLPLAFSSVRESDSIVRARSGQVVVIGGLMKDETRRSDAATPGLSDVPVVGGLFKHKRTSGQKTELVILLRPVVVDAAGSQNREYLRESAERLRRWNESGSGAR